MLVLFSFLRPFTNRKGRFSSEGQRRATIGYTTSPIDLV
ncbi:unnamed protein product [Prunus brigantina]